MDKELVEKKEETQKAKYERPLIETSTEKDILEGGREDNLRVLNQLFGEIF